MLRCAGSAMPPMLCCACCCCRWWRLLRATWPTPAWRRRVTCMVGQGRGWMQSSSRACPADRCFTAQLAAPGCYVFGLQVCLWVAGRRRGSGGPLLHSQAAAAVLRDKVDGCERAEALAVIISRCVLCLTRLSPHPPPPTCPPAPAYSRLQQVARARSSPATWSKPLCFASVFLRTLCRWASGQGVWAGLALGPGGCYWCFRAHMHFTHPDRGGTFAAHERGLFECSSGQQLHTPKGITPPSQFKLTPVPHPAGGNHPQGGPPNQGLSCQPPAVRRWAARHPRSGVIAGLL